MALKKETQTILGIGAASIITYLYLKNNKKKFSSFVRSDYDACVAQGNPAESCCAKFEGVFINGTCNPPSKTTAETLPPGEPKSQTPVEPLPRVTDICVDDAVLVNSYLSGCSDTIENFQNCCAKIRGIIVNGTCYCPSAVPPPPPPPPTDTGIDTDTGSGTSTDTTTTAANTGNSTTTINIPSNPIIFPVPVFSSNAVSSGDGFSPSSSSAAAATADEFDWIPIILGGITVALSIISEK
jgi:hypothetical protein